MRARLGDRLRDVIFFGSQAGGDATQGSDYDVLGVVDRKNQTIREIIIDTGVAMMDIHEVLFAALVYDEQEWDAQSFPLTSNIRREGIVL